MKLAAMALPFRAPVYRNYFEAFLGLYKQGVRGFYKGNGVRCIHILLFHRMNTDLTILSESAFAEQMKKLNSIPLAKELALSCLIDFALHPLHLAEARFIMQHNSPNFAVYKNLRHFFRTSWSEMFRGILLHIPRNICIAMSKINSNHSLQLA